IALRGTAPLAGEGSIGQVAALAVFGGAAVTAMVVLSTLTRRSLPWFGGRHWWRRALDVAGLSLVYGLLGPFLTGALFAVFQQAFPGVAPDRVAGTFWVAAGRAAAPYITPASGGSLTGRSRAPRPCAGGSPTSPSSAKGRTSRASPSTSRCCCPVSRC